MIQSLRLKITLPGIPLASSRYTEGKGRRRGASERVWGHPSWGVGLRSIYCLEIMQVLCLSYSCRSLRLLLVLLALCSAQASCELVKIAFQWQAYMRSDRKYGLSSVSGSARLFIWEGSTLLWDIKTLWCLVSKGTTMSQAFSSFLVLSAQPYKWIRIYTGYREWRSFCQDFIVKQIHLLIRIASHCPCELVICSRHIDDKICLPNNNDYKFSIYKMYIYVI